MEGTQKKQYKDRLIKLKEIILICKAFILPAGKNVSAYREMP